MRGRYFMIGKGGVGKTTCSAALSLKLSEKFRTLVVSIDPAHNLGDVLGLKLDDRPKEVLGNLWAVEVNIDNVVREYLNEMVSNLKKIYKYIEVINLDRYFDVLKYSPGVEEYAILKALSTYIRSDYDAVVFDTPPTGLTLRVLSLPNVTSVWLEKLIELRKAILDRRRTIESISGKNYDLPSREEEDGVMKELLKMKEDTDWLKEKIIESRIFGVVNPDELSYLEMMRAKKTLEELGLKLHALIVNRVEGDVNLEKFRELCDRVYVVGKTEKTGLERLKIIAESLP